MQCSSDDALPRDDPLASIVQHAVKEFTWPMGDVDSGEIIRATLPVSLIRAEAECGGNVRVQWETNRAKPGVVAHDNPGLFLIKQDNVDSQLNESFVSKRPRRDNQDS